MRHEMDRRPKTALGRSQGILNKTCKRHTIICRTDANGQIGNGEGRIRPPRTWPPATLSGRCQHGKNQNWTPKTNGKAQKKRKRDERNMGARNERKYLATWTARAEKSEDKSTTSRSMRTTGTRPAQRKVPHTGMQTWENPKNRGQTMQLYYNGAKKYKKPTPTETGKILKYGVRELRLHPEKLTQRYQNQETEEE